MYTSKELLHELNIKKTNSGACSGITWLNTKSNTEIKSINPHDESTIASVIACNEKHYEKIIQNAQKTFLTWREVPAPKRGELVRQIGDALRQQKEFLGALVSLESGKSLPEGLGEVQEMIDMADFAVGQSRMLYGKTMHSERPLHRMYEQWHPLGVVGIITAFNFPVAVWAWNAFIAAIAGNTVIWKPSSKVPLCAIAVQHICNKVMRENKVDGIFSLAVFNDKKLANLLVDDTRVSLVSFTGSTVVGRQVGERVAKRLGRSLLELGGNNAVIVDETADLELATRAIVFGAIGTAGQRCTTIRRLIIHETIYDVLITKLIHAYKQIEKTKKLTGPLIDRDAVKHFATALQQIKKLGGKIICGGEILKQLGYFVEPAMVEAKNHWDLVQQETFAPILYVMKYKKFDEAIKMHNQAKHGLSSALFTNDLKRAEYFLSVMGSDCGIANINIGTSGAEIGGAFGGEKYTGGGREAGSDAWKNYMRRQTNTINWSNALPLAQGIKFN